MKISPCRARSPLLRSIVGSVTLSVTGAAVLLTAALVTSGPVAAGQRSHVDHAGHGQVPDAAQAAAMVTQQRAPVRGSEFRAECRTSHRGPNDPIVFPGQTGVSHIHEFFGNRTTDANSTLQSLRLGSTNCDPAVDLSAYWTPTLYQNGQPVAPERVEFLITYPVTGGGLTLAGTRGGANVTTAPGYTFHGDFINAWDPAELQRRVGNCINAGYICGTDGDPIDQQ